MSMSVEILEHEVTALLETAVNFLCELISFPSLSGSEETAMQYLEEKFNLTGFQVESIPLSNALIIDPEYSDPIVGLNYEGRRNLRITVPGCTPYRLILNAHLDVVPAAASMAEPWIGKVRDGAVYGRGACDDKGQIAILYLLLSVLAKQNITPMPTLVLHLVVEEENGGNGTLGLIRHGEEADGAIVLEPTDQTIVIAARGAVWFRINFNGKGAHSGNSSSGKSALGLARQAMNIIEQYHEELLSQSRDVEFFDQYENPMPVTFGLISSGDWPASAPSKARLEGVFAFLPNLDREDVCQELRLRLSQAFPDPETFEIQFTFRHNGFVIDEKHPLPNALLDAARMSNFSCKPGAMPASSDAWLYHQFLGIPTLLFGAGSLKNAHSDNEHILLSDMRGVCLTLLNLVLSDTPGMWVSK